MSAWISVTFLGDDGGQNVATWLVPDDAAHVMRARLTADHGDPGLEALLDPAYAAALNTAGHAAANGRVLVFGDQEGTSHG